MTRYFYDTEFIEQGPGHPLDLVSIGMVAQDGREYYAVSSEFNVAALHRNPWLTANVWPSLPVKQHIRTAWTCQCLHGHFDFNHTDVRSRAQIADEVRDFILGDDPDQLPYVELWADYGAYDHVVLCQLWGSMVDLPEGMPMFTHDIQQEAARLGLSYKDLPQQESGLHNALADARHTKVKFDFLDAA